MPHDSNIVHELGPEWKSETKITFINLYFVTIDRTGRFQARREGGEEDFQFEIAWEAYSPYHTTGRFSYGKSKLLILNTIYLSKSFSFWAKGKSAERSYDDSFQFRLFHLFIFLVNFLQRLMASTLHEKKVKKNEICMTFHNFSPKDIFAIVWFIISSAACCACDISRNE